MRPLNDNSQFYDQIMLCLSKFGLNDYAENTCFWSSNLNSSEILRRSFEDNFGEHYNILHAYTKTMNLPSAVLVGGWGA